jgi:hypothetical protein
MLDFRMLHGSEIALLQDQYTKHWHRTIGHEHGRDVLRRLITEQHQRNFALWHEEDFARAPDASESAIAKTKRKIDLLNQERNDIVEQIDLLLLEELAASGLPEETSELSSETPGQMIDRMSILALKIYHTNEEIEREDSPSGHKERNIRRLGILEEQCSDLCGCLDRLWLEVLQRTRRFKRYRQYKMYNDPSLNPQIYNSKSRHDKWNSSIEI